MRRTFRFTVSSSSWTFPADMLRYDRCYPVDTDSALEIGRCRVCCKPLDGRVTVHLIGGNQPTEGRWNSFGWLVDSWVEDKY